MKIYKVEFTTNVPPEEIAKIVNEFFENQLDISFMENLHITEIGDDDELRLAK